MDPYRPNPKRSGWVSVLYPAVTASSAIWTGFHPVEPGPDPPGTPSGPLREDPPGFLGNCDFSRFTVNPGKCTFGKSKEDDLDPGNRGLGRILVSLGIEVRSGTRPDPDPVGVLTHLATERLRHLLSISVWTDKGRSSATKDLPSCERLAQDTSIILCQGFSSGLRREPCGSDQLEGMELIPSLTLC